MDRNKSGTKLKWRLGALILIGSVIGTAAAQQNNGVSIGFKSRMSDTEVLTLLKNYNLIPSRTYIAVSGFSGSHGSDDTATTSVERDLLIERARNETIAFFGKALEGNTSRLQRLVDANPPERMVQNQELNSNLRNLLKLRGQFETVLREAKSGAPLIYAIDVQASPTILSSLRQDSAVRIAFVRDNTQLRAQSTQTLRPDDANTEYVDHEIDALTSEEVFSRVIALMDPSRPPAKNGNPGLARQ